MPTPTPEESQIEEIRTIARVTSYSEIEIKVNALSDAGWSATVSDIAEFAKVKNKFYRTSQDIPIEYKEKRLEITNRIRLRLGYSEINENGDPLSLENRNESYSSANVDNEIAW